MAEAAVTIPLAACAPFALLLVSVAVLPLVAPHWWHKTSSKGLVATLLGGAAAAWTLSELGLPTLLVAAEHYVSFIALIGALFVISGGIFLHGDLRATPAVNTAFLATGAVLASVIGTTGASMLLIRPVLRTNSERRHVAHTVIFFIFLVSNVGGCLTPIGDPPLYLGYLEGVPFAWTLGLWREWVFMVVALLAIYWVLDRRFHRRETAVDLRHDEVERAPLRLQGGLNLLLLPATVLVVVLVKEPLVPHAAFVRDGLLIALALLSLRFTPKGLHAANDFNWHPLLEVVVVFAGVFAAMEPALLLLEQRGPALGLSEPWQFFWATGLLSGLLDNAPTYLTFGSVATGVMNAATPGLGLSADHLGGLLEIDPVAHAQAARLGAELLVAISLGAVFMGALTYIGNGPNFMVKAIAEKSGVRMPSFAGYLVWSLLIFVPLCLLMTFLFLT